MGPLSRPVSLVAERAVRYLQSHGGPATSLEMARDLLATRAPDEASARQLLETAFAGDPRLAYRDSGWHLGDARRPTRRVALRPREPEPDRTLIFIRGAAQSRGKPFELASVSVIRLQGDEVLAACGGDTITGPVGNRLRRAVRETLDGAVPVLHDPPGGIAALERWLGEALDLPISLRKLGQRRLALPASHDVEALVSKLDMVYREMDDPLEQADTLDACLQALRRDGETLSDLRAALSSGAYPIDWTRFAFGRDFLRRVPAVPGTYRFYDTRAALLYVGKSKNLQQRLGSYFREGVPRPARVQKLLDDLYRIEYEVSGSELEATLLEAEMIANRDPSKNVQRKIEPRKGRAGRLRSILILEPAEPPSVLRAYMIRSGRLLDRVAIGPRGGGLRRIQRVLEDNFFSAPAGPSPAAGPDLDVEIVVRWLASNRDRVVAFDPTDLQNADEVVERLRWFLDQGSPFDTDGSPILTR